MIYVYSVFPLKNECYLTFIGRLCTYLAVLLAFLLAGSWYLLLISCGYTHSKTETGLPIVAHNLSPCVYQYTVEILT